VIVQGGNVVATSGRAPFLAQGASNVPPRRHTRNDSSGLHPNGNEWRPKLRVRIWSPGSGRGAGELPAATPRRVSQRDASCILRRELRVTVEEPLLFIIAQVAQSELCCPQRLRRGALAHEQPLIETGHQQRGGEVIDGPEARDRAGAARPQVSPSRSRASSSAITGDRRGCFIYTP
jgi:hypothetical protein